MKRDLESALYVDCETDIERAEFFASGRAHDTGIVAKAIEMDIARAFFAKAWTAEISYPKHMTEDGA